MREIALTEQVMQVLKPALHGAKGTIKSEIRRGISQLYLTNNSALYLVLRPEGKQLVVVAVAGSGLKESRQEIIDFAKNNNFSTIRFHTKHPKRLKKGLQGLPTKLVEVRESLLQHDELIYQLNLNEV